LICGRLIVLDSTLVDGAITSSRLIDCHQVWMVAPAWWGYSFLDVLEDAEITLDARWVNDDVSASCA